MPNIFIWPIDRTLSGATTPYESGPGNNCHEWILCIPQSSSIIGASPSDCLVILRHSLGESITLLLRCSRCILGQIEWPQKKGDLVEKRLSKLEMNTATWVQILDKAVCISYSAYTRLCYGQMVGQTRFFNQGIATSLGKEKLWI